MELSDSNTALPITDAPVLTDAQWVNVVVLGGDAHRLDYVDGMTVAQALEQAELQLERGQVITVNGQPVDSEQVIEPGSVVQLTSRVKNG